MSACLGQHEMEGLIAGNLVESTREKAERHLAECTTCHRRFDALRADAAMVDAIKGSGFNATETAVKSPPTALLARLAPKSGEEPADARGDAVVAKPPDIPGYEIISLLHRGGQGAVYKAVQTATRRTVAIKLLLFGAASSPRQQRRFEREIDLISTLQHPHIVALYDSGTVNELPYMVMEYVRGQPLHEYVATVKPPLELRLRLFSKICAAVAHAQMRGVIHRDLKPANILVDTLGEPRILDFGLAKAMGRDLVTGGRPVSLTHEFFGTLAYASPEQARGQHDLIDIRTDVYSLGVILYELITGTFPYQVAGDIASVLQNIIEAAPEPPSTFLKRSAGRSASSMPSGSVSSFVPGLRRISDDLETIVLKALSKDRERRYASAEALRQDIEHCIAHEPIDAKRDSFWYIVYNHGRRHVYATALLLCVLVIFVSAGAIGFYLYTKESEALTELKRQSAQAKAATAQASLAVEGLHGRPRAMQLGWFLAEWNESRLGRAREIANGFPQGSALRKCVEYLLKNEYEDGSTAAFLNSFSDADRGLALFAAGELARRHGDAARATALFDECQKTVADPDVVRAARARLEQLTAESKPHPPAGDAGR